MGQKPEGGAHPVWKEHEHHPNKTSMHNAQHVFMLHVCARRQHQVIVRTQNPPCRTLKLHVIPLKTASKPTPKPPHLTAEKM